MVLITQRLDSRSSGPDLVALLEEVAAFDAGDGASQCGSLRSRTFGNVSEGDRQLVM